MNYDISIDEIEVRLKRSGITVDEFCKDIGIVRSTWTRWKAGSHSPNLSKWREVIAKLPQAAA